VKWLLFLSATAAIVLMGYTRINLPSSRKVDKEAYNKAILKKRFSISRCAPDWSTYHISNEDIHDMIPLPGTGSHIWKISTRNDSAQFYFNQGINLYYGFHIVEALPSFKKAQTFDSTCAMLYWAEALAYGPNINDFGYAASPDALLALSKAKRYSNTDSSKETELVDAMQAHYSEDSTRARALLNQEYADKMKALYIKYVDDGEIGTLYADALMNLHPWDLWYHDGNTRNIPEPIIIISTPWKHHHLLQKQTQAQKGLAD